MARIYKITTAIMVTEEEVLNYLGYSADSDYEPTDDEWEMYVDDAFWSAKLDYEVTPIV